MILMLDEFMGVC